MFNRMVFLALACTLSLVGCGAWQSVSDASVEAYHSVFFKQVKVLSVDISARASINPDEAGRAHSVAVRVYQLKDRKLFEGASYADLLNSDKTVLAQDLQAVMAAIVNPGAAASLSQSIAPDVEYVGVVAFFREVGGERSWRRVVAKKKLSPDAPLRIELVNAHLVVAGDVSEEQPAP